MANITSDLIGQREQRLENVRKLRALGINPYPSISQKDFPNKNVTDNYGEFEGKNITMAGRLIRKREHGKLIFGDIQDTTGKIQIALKKDELLGDLKNDHLEWDQLNLVDVGDFVQVAGKVSKTEQDEITLFVQNIKILTKSIRPLPQTFSEKEEQFRKRYLDLVINPERKDLFKRKAHFWKVNRDFMNSRGFIEVETPVMEHVTGGADAAPFTTHHNALDQDFFLRISTELYQKRLVGGGFEKIFTVGPNFRNEGLSDEHLQEFYQIEWYWAYANYTDNMNMLVEMFRYIAKQVYGKTKFTTRGHTFDLASDWEEIDYASAIKKRFNIDIFSSTEEEMITQIKNAGVELTGAVNRNRLIDNLWKIIRKDISGPAFLINEPAFMSPLAKAKDKDSKITERFHIVIAGSELGNGYSEINDPEYQLQQFLDQQNMRESGDDEAQMLDIDYVEMLEYGMPPASGYAHSERLFWFLEDITAREGTLFPQMRIEHDEITKKIYKGKVNFNEKTQFPDLNDEGLFSIGKSAKEKWPTINVGFAIIKGINVAKTNPELEELKKELYPQFETLTNETISAYPEILSYRKMYKEMGIDWHSRRPSPEALLRRLAKGKGLYTVNTVVDAYNIVVMKNRVSSGAFDLDKISFPTVLRLAKKGEKIHLLGDDVPIDYSESEIAYFDQNGGFNIDFNYRDAQRTAVQLDTKNIMINIDGVYDITREQVEKTLKETIDMITKYCGGKVEIAGIVQSTK